MELTRQASYVTIWILTQEKHMDNYSLLTSGSVTGSGLTYAIYASQWPPNVNIRMWGSDGEVYVTFNNITLERAMFELMVQIEHDSEEDLFRGLRANI